MPLKSFLLIALTIYRGPLKSVFSFIAFPGIRKMHSSQQSLIPFRAVKSREQGRNLRSMNDIAAT
jgi:hypothetical protein